MTEDAIIAARGMAFAATLAVVSAEDTRALRIPDSAVGIGLILSLLFSRGLTSTLLGALAGFALFCIVRWVRPHGLGLGDVKLGLYIGAVLGPWRLWMAVGVASVAALFVCTGALLLGRAGRDTPLPFAPFLALGGLAAWAIGVPASVQGGMVWK